MAWKWLEKLDNTRPFSENEAWWLYRAVAIGEAVGWTVLIAGLLIRHYRLWGHAAAVPIAGQIHGMLFLAYFGILIAVASSLRWSHRKLLMALLVGVPPYGSIIFEQWAAYHRHATHSRQHFYSIAYITFLRLQPARRG